MFFFSIVGDSFCRFSLLIFRGVSIIFDLGKNIERYIKLMKRNDEIISEQRWTLKLDKPLAMFHEGLLNMARIVGMTLNNHGI